VCSQSPRATVARPPTTADPVRYQITELDVEATSGSRMAGLNNAGQVAGNGEQGAFFWDPNTGLESLETLGYVVDINEVGQVASMGAPGGNGGHVFLWDPRSGVQDLGTPIAEDGAATAGGAFPTALNDHGMVVGEVEVESASQGYQSGVYRWDPNGDPTPFGESSDPGESDVFYKGSLNNDGQAVVSVGGRIVLWGPGSNRQDLGEGFGRLINERGQVVGVVGPFSNDCAFLWDPDTGSRSYLGRAQASAINDTGQVTGSFLDVNGDERAFIWGADTGLIDLGLLPGADWSGGGDINESGRVVGASGNHAGGWTHAFIWDPASGMTDLGTLEEGGSAYAREVNDGGQVLGWAGPYPEDSDGEAKGRVVLWTPR
jgi:probable HAF family extracellular repeat protein